MTGPGSEPWEVYTVKDDARPDLEGKTSLDLSAVSGDGTCCATDVVATDATQTVAKQPAGACC